MHRQVLRMTPHADLPFRCVVTGDISGQTESGVRHEHLKACMLRHLLPPHVGLLAVRDLQSEDQPLGRTDEVLLRIGILGPDGIRLVPQLSNPIQQLRSLLIDSLLQPGDHLLHALAMSFEGLLTQHQDPRFGHFHPRLECLIRRRLGIAMSPRLSCLGKQLTRFLQKLTRLLERGRVRLGEQCHLIRLHTYRRRWANQSGESSLRVRDDQIDQILVYLQVELDTLGIGSGVEYAALLVACSEATHQSYRQQHPECSFVHPIILFCEFRLLRRGSR
jgi:hypothetical protein